MLTLTEYIIIDSIKTCKLFVYMPIYHYKKRYVKIVKIAVVNPYKINVYAVRQYIFPALQFVSLNMKEN